MKAKFCLFDEGGETIKVDIEGKVSDLIDLLAESMISYPKLKEIFERSLEKANEMSQKGDLTDLISMMEKMMGGGKK
jgi:hypothetical protein